VVIGVLAWFALHFDLEVHNITAKQGVSHLTGHESLVIGRSTRFFSVNFLGCICITEPEPLVSVTNGFVVGCRNISRLCQHFDSGYWTGLSHGFDFGITCQGGPGCTEGTFAFSTLLLPSSADSVSASHQSCSHSTNAHLTLFPEVSILGKFSRDSSIGWASTSMIYTI